ncbi:MAG: pantoate--beta-alanine ligase [Armatimonadetes bacterium]|nr:pantoate--beta-alanine ligase [Armatimonadota bacterium]
MRIARTVAEINKARHEYSRLGFVPTMGALHKGHLELMRTAKAKCGFSAASIFVNPIQFGPKEDLAKYPRDESADLELMDSVGVDLVFLPSVDEVLGGNVTTVQLAGPAVPFEGVSRPTHFQGVATIVLKLFNIIKPDVAYFGLKDLQQCAVVRKMVEDLFVPVELEFVETIRESDGLALSSRNRYLEPSARTNASLLFRSLTHIANEVHVEPTKFSELKEDALATLRAAGFDVEYLEMVDMRTMTIDHKPNAYSRIVIAAKYNGVRLIDNVGLVIHNQIDS